MNTTPLQASEKRWRVAQWPPLAWLETVIKLVAILIGILTLVDALSTGNLTFPDGLPLTQLVVLALLSLGLVAAIFDRLVEREIVAMVFVILNNLGHWGMVLGLLAPQHPGSRLLAFAALMLVGDLVKLFFLKVHNFQVRDTPRSVLYGLTLFYVVGYVILLLLELAR